MAPVLSKNKKIGLALALSLPLIITRKKRRLWAKKWLNRHKFSHITLLKELNSEDYRNYLRMDSESFDELLSLVRPLITRKNTLMREAVSAEERLIATLRYLATGRDYADLKFSTAISPQLLSRIIPETCEAIYRVLKNYIKLPATEMEWLMESEQFQKMWQFNNCIGAIDGKHILIQKPPGSGSLYYNYKGTFSTVLLAVVNANYQFLYVHTGINGSISDGGVLKQTKFYKKLTSGQLNIPNPTALPGTNSTVPYVFLGDSAFALTKHILKPFPQKNLNRNKRIFNYRLSRARRVVENVFGILTSRFRVFLKPILIDVENVDKLILASCALHNFLRKKSKNYIINTSVDWEDTENGILRQGDWRRQDNNILDLEPPAQREITEEGKNVRNVFTEYFNGNGRVDFQDKMIDVINTKYTCI